jgi:HEAT repeats
MASSVWVFPTPDLPHATCLQRFSGDYTGGVTPVPIPNTVVKPSRAHGTARVTAWESRSSPGLNSQNALASCWGVFVFLSLEHFQKGKEMAFLPIEDPRSTSELFAATLQGNYEDDASWQAVAVLRLRGTIEVLEAAAEYTRSEDPKARARGLDVLAQLGAGKDDSERPHLNRCVSIAIESLKDGNHLVVHSAAWALAHLGTDHAVAALLLLKGHSDPGVRWAVAYGVAARKGPGPITTLIELMSDSDENVRDWATFGLGSISTADSPEIRTALHERLTDPFQPARSEAVWGLALREDPPGLRMLLERVEAETWQSGDEYVAQEILNLDPDTPADKLREGLRELIR